MLYEIDHSKSLATLLWHDGQGTGVFFNFKWRGDLFMNWKSHPFTIPNENKIGTQTMDHDTLTTEIGIQKMDHDTLNNGNRYSVNVSQ